MNAGTCKTTVTSIIKINLPVFLAAAPEQFKLWFAAGTEFDTKIRSEYSHLIQNTQVSTDESDPETAFGKLILFDQLPRNAFRNTAEAFAYDEKALQLAKQFVSRGWDREMNPVFRGFLYLPFEHSESLAEQETCLQLYKQLDDHVQGDAGLKEKYGGFTGQFLQYAQKHWQLIRDFGRFPHRNYVLGRQSTPQEEAYLNGGGETFGVTKHN